MAKARCYFIGAVMSVMAGAASAATSLVDLGFPDQSNGGFGGYVVQSITATVDNLAGIQVLVGGSNIDQTATISIELYADAGLNTLLASGTDDVDGNNKVSGSSSFDDFADVFWSPVELILGEVYYLRFDTTNAKMGFYSFGTPVLDVYSGGQVVAVTGKDPFEDNSYTDIASVKIYTDPDFGKTPDQPVDPIPLPAGLPLALTGMGALLWQTRRRAR